jgi:hypothetical protein
VDTEFASTKHQTPRGTRPDADVGNNLYLLKNVSMLRLTYQIRLLAYFAHSKGKKVVIRLPREAEVHESLRNFVRDSKGLVGIERA